MPERMFWLDKDGDPMLIGGIDRFVIVGDGCPVVERRTNGSAFHMTFKSRSWAERALTRIKNSGVKLDARVVDIFDKRSGQG